MLSLVDGALIEDPGRFWIQRNLNEPCHRDGEGSQNHYIEGLGCVYSKQTRLKSEQKTAPVAYNCRPLSHSPNKIKKENGTNCNYYYQMPRRVMIKTNIDPQKK